MGSSASCIAVGFLLAGDNPWSCYRAMWAWAPGFRGLSLTSVGPDDLGGPFLSQAAWISVVLSILVGSMLRLGGSWGSCAHVECGQQQPTCCLLCVIHSCVSQRPKPCVSLPSHCALVGSEGAVLGWQGAVPPPGWHGTGWAGLDTFCQVTTSPSFLEWQQGGLPRHAGH